MTAFQDLYPEESSHCYGCGRLNEAGLQIKSYWDGNESVCTYQPREHHTAVPGYVYGGLIASLIDCHSTGTAAAAAFKAAGSVPGTEADFRFLTGSLHVDYLKPTPIDGPLTIRAYASEIKGRKVVVKSTLYAGDLACATGEVVAIQVTKEFVNQLINNATDTD
ncbi:MAG: PaaI family thioesterase [Chloroflexi bacterium]|nr:PaaI family thioesterase [Chloroflexota bacterium]